MTRTWTIRAVLLCGALLLAAPMLVTAAPADEAPEAASGDMPYAGQSIRVLHDKRPNTANLLDLLPEFEEATGISVTVDIMPESEVFAKEQVELSQQVGTYDVMQYIWLFQPGWERAGWMIDLNPYIADAGKTFPGWARSDFDDSVLGILSVNDKQLGIPFISFTNGLLYNDILFKKYDVAVPTTLEEFEAAAAKLTREDPEIGQIYGYMARGGRRGTEDTNSWIQVLNLFGGKFFDDEWNCSLNAPEAVASLEWYVRMVEDYAPPGAKRAGWTEVVTEFTQGRVGMIMEGFVVWEQYNDPEQSKIAGNVGLAQLPDSPERGLAVGGAWGLGIPNTAKNKDAAWQYIQWLTSTPVASRLFLATTREANLAVYSVSPNAPGAPPMDEVVAKIFADTDPAGYPPITNWNEVSDKIGLMFSNALSGEMGAQQAADEACEAIDPLMERAGY